ncbi:hypothetical protein ABW19_dt0207957 [Dactylella cylindrospora]|nr:hypothetical protein ABW19_dt0207957 [Dactylella cylindrospora]
MNVEDSFPSSRIRGIIHNFGHLRRPLDFIKRWNRRRRTPLSVRLKTRAIKILQPNKLPHGYIHRRWNSEYIIRRRRRFLHIPQNRTGRGPVIFKLFFIIAERSVVYQCAPHRHLEKIPGHPIRAPFPYLARRDQSFHPGHPVGPGNVRFPKNAKEALGILRVFSDKAVDDVFRDELFALDWDEFLLLRREGRWRGR